MGKVGCQKVRIGAGDSWDVSGSDSVDVLSSRDLYESGVVDGEKGYVLPFALGVKEQVFSG